MSEEKVELPEFVEWRGMRLTVRWGRTAEGCAHFQANLDDVPGVTVRGIYDREDSDWPWWIAESVGSGGHTFAEAMEKWHRHRLKAGDEARLIEEETCAPTKRTGEV